MDDIFNAEFNFELKDFELNIDPKNFEVKPDCIEQNFDVPAFKLNPEDFKIDVDSIFVDVDINI